MLTFSHLRLLFHTVHYLRPVQIFGRLWFRIYSPAAVNNPLLPLRSAVTSWINVAHRSPSMLAANHFIFLNEECALTGSDSWNDPARDKLWLYNLHYFDDLNAEGAGARTAWHQALISRWIADNPPTSGNGWEPYPISLRIVNWIKWALQGNELKPAWLDSLAMQVRYLRKRLEYHLLGNHLFANAKALVFAGLYFSGDEAEEWLAKGLSILERELPEQVLEDGGHFELSPMYHGIILEDLLDLVNVGRVFAARAPLLQRLDDDVLRMLSWLKTMCHPDGGIGFFNDATFGIAPGLAELEVYAERLGLASPIESTGKLTYLRDSGFVRIEQDEAVALLDVGEIGPDYLPGHAHADTLSFELSLFDQRIIVNSGISCYGASVVRLRQRGTADHSTVEVDGENSSEVWSGFRVARRARPFGLKIQENPNAVSVSCAHDGYRRLSGSPVHNRCWEFQGGRLVVTDSIQGEFSEAVVYYHLHPNVSIRYTPGAFGGEFELDTGQSVNWSVSGGQISIEETTYHPGFGLDIPKKTIKVVFTGREAVFTLQWKNVV